MAGYTPDRSGFGSHHTSVGGNQRTSFTNCSTVREVNNLLENLKKTNARIVGTSIPGVISPGSLRRCWQICLEKEFSSVIWKRSLKRWAITENGSKDTDMLTEYVRQALKRTISHRFSEAGQMKVDQPG